MLIKKLTWQIFATCLVITVVSLWITTWYSGRVYNQLYQKTLINDVCVRARLLIPEFSALVADSSKYSRIDTLCKMIGYDIGTRLTVILPSGRVIGDTDKESDSMENHAARPEVIRALSGTTGMQKRFSASLHQDMVYVAVPLGAKTKISAVLRLSMSLQDISNHEHQFYGNVALVSFALFVVLIFIAYVVSRQLSRPIKLMVTGARRFAGGDFGLKLQVPAGEELGGLANALNAMAAALDDRIRTITQQRNELGAVLTGMTEGVIAVDRKERIISMNPVALNLLDVKGETFQGKWLHEVVRNSELRRFCAKTLKTDTIVETSLIVLLNNDERFIQARGSVLKDESGAISGAVLVLNDLTGLHKLETTQKEFVSNVSHELLTPLTSIKGFVETIQQGDYGLSKEVKYFLDIIVIKTDRLCSIVDDILTLSSIQRDAEQNEIPLDKSSLLIVLEDAIKTCTAKAATKRIGLELTGEADVCADINAPLLEQAVVNLIDNAVKYSGDNKNVKIDLIRTEKETVISVTDQGFGIPHEHLGRVFERFYRVDKARSKKLGGTGLGLSIVKNIVFAHNGNVSVDSQPGIGSTFRIHLPNLSQNNKETVV